MEEVTNILNACGETAVKQLRETIRSKSANGALADSIGYEVKEGILQITAAEHLPFVLFGRGPGKPPPRKAIEQWIDAKGIVSEISRQSLAYLIQRKIAQEGTEGVLRGGNMATAVLTPALLSQIKTNLNTFFKNTVVRHMRAAINNKA